MVNFLKSIVKIRGSFAFLEFAIFILVHSIFLVLSHSLVNGFSAGLSWGFYHPTPMIVSLLILVFLSCFLFSLTASLRFSLLVLIVPILVLSIVCHLKKQNLGSFLYPWDFYLSNEALSMVPALMKSPNLILFLLFASLLILSAFAIRIPWYHRKHWPIQFRVFVGLTSAMAVGLLVLANNPLHDHLFGTTFQFDMKNPRASFQVNGLIVSFILLVEQGEVYPPADYSVIAAQDLFQKFSNTTARSPNVVSIPEERPDIVVVMSESLFDPLRLSGIEWKEDPLAFTRHLTSHRALSAATIPTFGFRTANTEFEFLTGHSMEFFAKGTIPYVHLISDHQLSMIDSLHRVGYQAIAIHPGARTFYERDRVYKLLGFDRFESQETFVGAPHFGNYFSDQSILPVLKRSLETEDHPTFHFIVTIQNHYPYTNNPFTSTSHAFNPEKLTGAEKVVLNYYTDLIEETDRFHGDLVKYLEKRGKPVLLVIFGDHLPGLLPNYGGYVGRMVNDPDPSRWSRSETEAMMTTPLVLWSNFKYSDETSPIDINFVGVRILRNLGIPMSPYQKFVAELSDHVRQVNPRLREAHNAEEKELLHDYKIFQYATFSHDIPNFSAFGENIHVSTSPIIFPNHACPR